jgi:hypothetical protein
MRSRILVVTLLMAGSLAACGSHTRVVSADANTVQIRYSGSRMEDANERAQRFCNQYGRVAQLRQTLPDSGSDHLALYDCLVR